MRMLFCYSNVDSKFGDLKLPLIKEIKVPKNNPTKAGTNQQRPWE